MTDLLLTNSAGVRPLGKTAGHVRVIRHYYEQKPSTSVILDSHLDDSLPELNKVLPVYNNASLSLMNTVILCSPVHSLQTGLPL